MLGKVKAILPEIINIGDKIVHQDSTGKWHIFTVFSVEMCPVSYRLSKVWCENDITKQRTYWLYTTICTLVVEYKQETIAPGSWIWKQIPLKWSKWQSAIDNGEVDSNEKITFKIVTREVYISRFSEGQRETAKQNISYAKIIPTKDKTMDRTLFEMLIEQRKQLLNELIKLPLDPRSDFYEDSLNRLKLLKEQLDLVDSKLFG